MLGALTIKKFLTSALALLLTLTSCGETPPPVSLQINNDSLLHMVMGDELILDITYTGDDPLIFESSDQSVSVNEVGLLTAVSVGSADISVRAGDLFDSIRIYVSYPEVIELSVSRNIIRVDETLNLITEGYGEHHHDYKYEIVSGHNNVEIDGSTLRGVNVGFVTLYAYFNHVRSNEITIEIISRSGLNPDIQITADKYYIKPFEYVTLSASFLSEQGSIYPLEFKLESGGYYGRLTDNILYGLRPGSVSVYAAFGPYRSESIKITVVEEGVIPDSITITASSTIVPEGEHATLSFSVTPNNASRLINYIAISGANNVRVEGDQLYSLNGKPFTIVGIIDGVKSNQLSFNDTDIGGDIYKNMTKEEFYQNYTPASSYSDAYFRSLYGFMSGSIAPQDQHATIASYQPTKNGKLLRNTSKLFDDNYNTYYVVDSYGEIVNTIYKGGGYITLDEVAAYIFAFGEVPANYIEDKSQRSAPATSKWGEYVRLNNTYFSGDVERYPYEPVLPNIRGAGGELYYYEVDIGTTGTDSDPRYPSLPYNTGSYINRGAARIVYTRYDGDNNPITNLDDKYLFYTYNHYNDFQEYLNYSNGWGEMFGNITGGGEISSYTNYNPTPYVEVERSDFTLTSSITARNERLLSLPPKFKNEDELLVLI